MGEEIYTGNENHIRKIVFDLLKLFNDNKMILDKIIIDQEKLEQGSAKLKKLKDLLINAEDFYYSISDNLHVLKVYPVSELGINNDENSFVHLPIISLTETFFPIQDSILEDLKINPYEIENDKNKGFKKQNADVKIYNGIWYKIDKTKQKTFLKDKQNFLKKEKL